MTHPGQGGFHSIAVRINGRRYNATISVPVTRDEREWSVTCTAPGRVGVYRVTGGVVNESGTELLVFDEMASLRTQVATLLSPGESPTAVLGTVVDWFASSH